MDSLNPSFMRKIIVLLFASAVFIFSVVISQKDMTYNKFDLTEMQDSPVIESERKNFMQAEKALDFSNMPVTDDDTRSLAEYYSTRAFPGAPPIIPHALMSEKGMGENNCLQCHQNGGFADVFKAYAPITPHPEWINCRQCHVPAKTDQLFRSSNWVKINAPELGNKALVSSPPIIPHGLQNRENCLSCHVGPSAPKELRVSHPERTNCRQCHVFADPLRQFEDFLSKQTFLDKN